MAARDRYGGFAEPPATPLQRYIQNACDPQNYEPNLALDLEISDMINAKQGVAPREAAVAIVNHINHRNPNVSLLALTLLDICVKNCGYPFHLQIGTKDFLNELVRRFPERPPLRYSRVQSKILELIEEWRQTICANSKYKDDLGFIRDMHRLLSYKGYTFPEVKREDAAVLNPSERLQSAEEMEAEERAAQSAKLQELIRRGTPADLQEANRLMKIMAGFDTRHKTDYRAKAAEEVGKVQQKARLLEEMLQTYKPGDPSINNESFEELGNALASAQPKIQKMCEEESEDTEAVAKLFEINDSIHRTLERYRLVKKGDLEAAAKIPKGTLGTSGAGVSKGPGNELNLIDFGAADAAPTGAPSKATSAPSAPPSRPEDDLLGLSLQDPAPSGAISLGNPPAGFSMMSSNPPIPVPSAPTVSSTANKPNYDLFGSIATKPVQSPIPNRPANPTPNIALTHSAPPQQQAKDPFAGLSTAPRGSSPFQYQQSIKSTSSPAPPLAQTSQFAAPAPAASTSATKAQPPSIPASASNNNIASNGDDDWDFASALPDQAHEVIVVNSNIHAVFLVSRPPEDPNTILINSSVSNNTPQPVSDLTFQVAVMKGLTLKLEPQSGRSLQPNQRAGITQDIRLQGAPPGKAQSIKVRWKASYWVGGQHKQEQGEIASLGIS